MNSIDCSTYTTIYLRSVDTSCFFHGQVCSMFLVGRLGMLFFVQLEVLFSDLLLSVMPGFVWTTLDTGKSLAIF